jgi:hypothetical protein
MTPLPRARTAGEAKKRRRLGGWRARTYRTAYDVSSDAPRVRPRAPPRCRVVLHPIAPGHPADREPSTSRACSYTRGCRGAHPGRPHRAPAGAWSCTRGIMVVHPAVHARAPAGSWSRTGGVGSCTGRIADRHPGVREPALSDPASALLGERHARHARTPPTLSEIKVLRETANRPYFAAGCACSRSAALPP